MIVEGLVTTKNADGTPNIAAMGPIVGPDAGLRRFVLRPFRSSTTYRNLKAHGEGVFHVTDDVLTLARSAIGLEVEARWRPAALVDGFILVGACRYAEFRVLELDDRDDRTTIRVEAVAEGRLRDHFGFNRAKHAVIEAAIMATRLDFLPMERVVEEFERLAVPVEKTGGPSELRAFGLLRDHVGRVAVARGIETGWTSGGPP